MGKVYDRFIGSVLIYVEKGVLFIEKWIDSYNNYDLLKWGDNFVFMVEKLVWKFFDFIYVFEYYCVFYLYGLVLYNQNYKWLYSYGLYIYKIGYILEF